MADTVLICTQDAVHADPAVAFAELGYHMLLEKPMATTEADCRRIVGAVERAGVILSVCHVLRYTRRRPRRTCLFGTHGELEGDGERVRVRDFLTGTSETLEAVAPGDATAGGGHGAATGA